MNPTIRIRAELDQLALIRQFVEATAAAWRLSAAVTDPLVLAVDELAVNAVVHGYCGRPGEIELEMERSIGAVILRLRDQAPVFDPTRLPDPDTTLPLERRPVGGMGVYLARCSVDSLTHQVTARGGNQLTLIKQTDLP